MAETLGLSYSFGQVEPDPLDTSPMGALDKPAPFGTHNPTPCEKCSKLGLSPRSGHASGFKHVFKPLTERKTKAPAAVYAKAATLKRQKHAKKADEKPLLEAAVLVKGSHQQTHGGILIYSKAPWAWSQDRKGRPIPLEA